jgi:hypothetical protein
MCGGDGVLAEQRSAVRSGRREGRGARRSTGRERASRSAGADRNDFGSQDCGDCSGDERTTDAGRRHTT